MGPVSPKPAGPMRVGKDRIESWKAVAAYLERDVRTAQRWEREWGLPIYRLPGGPKAGVYAFRSELDAWRESKRREIGEYLPSEAPPRRRRRLRLFATAALGLVLLAGLAAAVAVRKVPRTTLLDQSRFTPFATSLPVQACPAWSPDGKTIAFIGGSGGRTRIMTQPVAGGPPVAISDPEANVGAGDVWCRSPMWSADSQSLYFIAVKDGFSGFYRIAASGGDATLVQPRVLAGSVSPDGRTLVFLARDEKVYRMWVANPPDGPRRPYRPAPFEALTFANTPEVDFSPDGRQILVTITTDTGAQCWSLPWPEALPRRLFTGAERAVGGVRGEWMPDSRHVVFSGGGPLAAADVRSERYWPIAAQDHAMYAPAPSPDGTRIAYQLMLSHADIVAVPLGAGEPETMIGSLLNEQMPSVSPAAPQMVYVTNRRPRGIWICSLDGAWDRPLVTFADVSVRGEKAQLFLAPEFSFDGRRVLFAAVSPAAQGIFTVPAAGGAAVRVNPAVDIAGGAPSWSPDGQWITYRAAEAKGIRLMKTRIGSAAPPVELAVMCGRAMPEWSPSGEWIAFSGEGCRLSIIHPDGTGLRLLGGPGVIAWSRDSRLVYRIDPNAHAIFAVDVQSGTERKLRDVGNLLPYSSAQPGLRASLTPDGRKIVYSVLRPREEIWILEGVNIREPWHARLLSLVPRRWR